MARLFLVLFTTIFINLSHQQDIVRQNLNDRIIFQLEQQITSYVRQEVTYKAYASFFGRADVSLPGLQRFFSSYARTARKQAHELTELVIERGGRVRYPVVRLKDGCKFIEDELVKGTISKPRSIDDQLQTARQEPFICHFLLLDKKDTSHEKKEERRPRPGKAGKRKAKKNKRGKRSSENDNSRRGGWLSVFYGEKSSNDAGPVEDESGTRNSWQDGLYGLEDALAIEKSVQQELLPIIQMARRGIARDPQIYHELRFYLKNHVNSTYRVAELVKRLQRHQNLDTYDLEEYLLDNELKEK